MHHKACNMYVHLQSIEQDQMYIYMYIEGLVVGFGGVYVIDIVRLFEECVCLLKHVSKWDKQ